MKTTVFGLTGYSPDFNMLLINATSGIGKFILIFIKIVYNCFS
jgi:GTPase